MKQRKLKIAHHSCHIHHHCHHQNHHLVTFTTTARCHVTMSLSQLIFIFCLRKIGRNPLNFLSRLLITILITCCTKLLKFDWLRGMQLIPNCTGEIRAKTCNYDLIGCFCRAKSCNCCLTDYFCRAKTCNRP